VSAHQIMRVRVWVRAGGLVFRTLGVVMPHPGISMHKIPVTVGEGMGIVFVIGVIVPILIALPEARNFILVSLPIGVLVAIALRLIHRD